jgi:hypothetical protein
MAFDDIIWHKRTRTKIAYICNCRLCGYTKSCDEYEFARDYLVTHLLLDHKVNTADDADLCITREITEETIE